jgi:hypothetical protein
MSDLADEPIPRSDATIERWTSAASEQTERLARNIYRRGWTAGSLRHAEHPGRSPGVPRLRVHSGSPVGRCTPRQGNPRRHARRDQTYSRHHQERRRTSRGDCEAQARAQDTVEAIGTGPIASAKLILSARVAAGCHAGGSLLSERNAAPFRSGSAFLCCAAAAWLPR